MCDNIVQRVIHDQISKWRSKTGGGSKMKKQRKCLIQGRRGKSEWHKIDRGMYYVVWVELAGLLRAVQELG